MILLQLVSTTIANGVTDEVIKSTDGDLLRGETGSYVKNTTYEQLYKYMTIGGNNIPADFFTLWAPFA